MVSGADAAMDRSGQAFIEYFVIALIMLLATVAFYRAHLGQEGVGARAQVESVFVDVCGQVANAVCQ